MNSHLRKAIARKGAQAERSRDCLIGTIVALFFTGQT